MILPNKNDAIHKAWLYRVLEEIADDKYLPSILYFKGGTCASMLGWLDRFSIDLDFDYIGEEKDIEKTRESLRQIFKKLDLEIKDESKNGIQFFLKYKNRTGDRNTLKIEVSFPVYKSSKYFPQRLSEIDRIFTCQTKETMFAHKLVALQDRYKKTEHIAGRDIYDIHYFFMNGYDFDKDVIQERIGLEIEQFFQNLILFIEEKVTDKIITEDLGYLLSSEKFKIMRKVLKRETINFLKDIKIKNE